MSNAIDEKRFRDLDTEIANIERMAATIDEALSAEVLAAFRHPDFDKHGRIARHFEQFGRLADAMETFVATVRRAQHACNTR
jgi:hypothetical protein